MGFFVPIIPLIFHIQASSSYDSLCLLLAGVVDLIRLVSRGV